MPIWNDPLDDLIGDLDRAIPSAVTVSPLRPTLEDLQQVVGVILFGTPEEQRRALADPQHCELEARVFGELEAACRPSSKS